MDLYEYQERCQETAKFPAIGGLKWVYPALGLSGEAGEVSEKLKKILRDCDGKISKESLELISKEIGDVLWYVATLATALDLQLEDIAANNLSKLKSRKFRGTIGGSGDNR